MDWVIALVSLTAMEIVLGIDNVIFIAILVGKLPQDQQKKARQLGLGLALVMRLGLLFTLSWILGLDEPIFHLTDLGLPGVARGRRRDAGTFRCANQRHLLARHHPARRRAVPDRQEHLRDPRQARRARGEGRWRKAAAPVRHVLIQIAILDIVFSLDSVITAVGMAQRRHLGDGRRPMVIAVGVMLVFAGRDQRLRRTGTRR